MAELIANAYDADAKNVYVIANKDDITVEDDGKGMSYSHGDVDQYLHVAQESRISEDDSVTKSGRLKMGRKGIMTELNSDYFRDAIMLEGHSLSKWFGDTIADRIDDEFRRVFDAGERQGAVICARRMIAEKLPTDDIAKYTGLAAGEIKAL